jgi:hypothetical protein
MKGEIPSFLGVSAGDKFNSVGVARGFIPPPAGFCFRKSGRLRDA